MAAPSTSAFLDEYPEFTGADADLLTAALSRADALTNSDIFGTAALAENAIMLQAAIILAEAPMARKMRVDIPEGRILTYMLRLRRAQRNATMGLRVF